MNQNKLTLTKTLHYYRIFGTNYNKDIIEETKILKSIVQIVSGIFINEEILELKLLSCIKYGLNLSNDELEVEQLTCIYSRLPIYLRSYVFASHLLALCSNVICNFEFWASLYDTFKNLRQHQLAMECMKLYIIRNLDKNIYKKISDKINLSEKKILVIYLTNKMNSELLLNLNLNWFYLLDFSELRIPFFVKLASCAIDFINETHNPISSQLKKMKSLFKKSMIILSEECSQNICIKMIDHIRYNDKIENFILYTFLLPVSNGLDKNGPIFVFHQEYIDYFYELYGFDYRLLDFISTKLVCLASALYVKILCKIKETYLKHNKNINVYREIETISNSIEKKHYQKSMNNIIVNKKMRFDSVLGPHLMYSPKRPKMTRLQSNKIRTHTPLKLLNLTDDFSIF